MSAMLSLFKRSAHLKVIDIKRHPPMGSVND